MIYHARLCELKVSDGASFPELWSLVQSNSMLYTHREASLYKLLNRYQANMDIIDKLILTSASGDSISSDTTK